MNITKTQLANLLIEAEIINTKDTVREVRSDQFKKLRNSLNNILEGDHESENLQTAIDAAPCTISWVTSDLKYVAVNAALSESCGVDAAKFEGQPIGFLSGDDKFAQFAKDLFASNVDRFERELESTFNDATKWYYMVGRKYLGGKQAVMIGMDITEAKAAQDALIMQDKLAFIGTVSASIMHDIKNPLSVLSMCSDVFSDPSYELSRDELATQASLMQKAVKRISAIITTFKNFARDSSATNYHPYYLREIIGDAEQLWKPLWGTSGIKLTVTCAEDLMIHGSDVEVSQVITNLISNASQAIINQKEKWINIDATAAGENIQIKITDSGAGLPETVAQKIFQPFFTTKPKGEGTGLGLSICKKILDRHKGQISIDQDAKNTTFVLSIPSGVKMKATG